MKRLLKISLNDAIFSFLPILSWFLLGIVLDKNLANVFTITYPIQCIYGLLKGIFGTGANIYKEKEKNKDAVLSGITIGIVISFIIFFLFIIHVDSYLKFMNMDVLIYRDFTIYSFIQLYIQLVFSFVLEKLYFEEKETLASKCCITLNLLNFLILIGSAFLFHNSKLTIWVTLISIFSYVFYVVVKTFQKFQLQFHILKYIRYNSASIFQSFLFFIIYFFGLSTAFKYGPEYASALNFAMLLTDTEWDAFGAIQTVAKIDMSKNEFNYKEHIRNAYQLLAILFSFIFMTFIILYPFYQVSIPITLFYVGIDILNFLINPIYSIKICYLQLEDSPFMVTTNVLFSNLLRSLISLLNSPYCTSIGQIISAFYQFITINFLFQRKFKIKRNGKIERKYVLQN